LPLSRDGRLWGGTRTPGTGAINGAHCSEGRGLAHAQRGPATRTQQVVYESGTIVLTSLAQLELASRSEVAFWGPSQWITRVRAARKGRRERSDVP